MGKHGAPPWMAFWPCRFGPFDCSQHVPLPPGAMRLALNHAVFSKNKAFCERGSAPLGWPFRHEMIEDQREHIKSFPVTVCLCVSWCLCVGLSLCLFLCGVMSCVGLCVRVFLRVCERVSVCMSLHLGVWVCVCLRVDSCVPCAPGGEGGRSCRRLCPQTLSPAWGQWLLSSCGAC